MKSKPLVHRRQGAGRRKWQRSPEALHQALSMLLKRRSELRHEMSTLTDRVARREREMIMQRVNRALDALVDNAPWPLLNSLRKSVSDRFLNDAAERLQHVLKHAKEAFPTEETFRVGVRSHAEFNSQAALLAAHMERNRVERKDGCTPSADDLHSEIMEALACDAVVEKLFSGGPLRAAQLVIAKLTGYDLGTIRNARRAAQRRR